MRILLSAIALFWLTGCAAMMVGGANSGGYKPPPDQCAEDEQGENCKR